MSDPSSAAAASASDALQAPSGGSTSQSMYASNSTGYVRSYVFDSLLEIVCCVGSPSQTKLLTSMKGPGNRPLEILTSSSVGRNRLSSLNASPMKLSGRASSSSKMVRKSALLFRVPASAPKLKYKRALLYLVRKL